MSSRQQLGTATPQRPLVWVRGWQERLRPPLALVLARRNELGSPLQAVRFEPDGNLWLVTAALGEVRLGPPDARLNERLDVLEHLSSRLPGRVRGTTVRSIDLSDPDKPELGLRTPAAPPQRGAGGTGVD
jgi:cell division protein FtsQ